MAFSAINGRTTATSLISSTSSQSDLARNQEGVQGQAQARSEPLVLALKGASFLLGNGQVNFHARKIVRGCWNVPGRALASLPLRDSEVAIEKLP